MNVNKTTPNSGDVTDFLAALDDEQQREDSERLVELMSAVSGEPPAMWGTSIIGFGVYTYRYASGREGEWMRIGFSPRTGKLSLYVTLDTAQLADELDALGKYKVGKGCVYINRLADVDSVALRRFIEHAYEKSGQVAA